MKLEEVNGDGNVSDGAEKVVERATPAGNVPPDPRRTTGVYDVITGQARGRRVRAAVCAGSSSGADDRDLDRRLPDEIIEFEILHRLGLRDLMRSRLVCKRWDSIAVSLATPRVLALVMCKFLTFSRKKRVIAMLIDTVSGEQWELELPVPVSCCYLKNYSCSEGGLIAMTNAEESTFWVGNPVTDQWLRIRYPPYPSEVNQLEDVTQLFELVVTGCSYKIVVLLVHQPGFGSEPQSIHALIFDSESQQWKKGLPNVYLRSWAWDEIVYFEMDSGIWGLDPNIGSFHQLTTSLPPFPKLHHFKTVPYSSHLVVTQHLGVQQIEIVGMVLLTVEQERRRANLSAASGLEWHLRAWRWDVSSQSWIVRKEVCTDNLSPAKTPLEWGAATCAGYRVDPKDDRHHHHVCVYRTDTLEELRYTMNRKDLMVSPTEDRVMLFHPRFDTLP